MQNLMIPTKEMLIEKYQLYPIKKYGSIATITDYAILNGGYSTKQNEGTYFLNNIESQGEYRPYFVSYLDETGKIKSTYCPKGVGIRPVLNFSPLKDEVQIVDETAKMLIGYFGTFLQDAPSKELQDELTNTFIINNLCLPAKKKEEVRNILNIKTPVKTNLSYIRNRNSYESFTEEKLNVYQYKNKNYAKVTANTLYSKDNNFTLSNKENYKNGDSIWIEEKKVKWFIDLEKDLMISEKIIQAGIKFSTSELFYNNVCFEETDFYKYLSKYMTDELVTTNKILIKNKSL